MLVHNLLNYYQFRIFLPLSLFSIYTSSNFLFFLKLIKNLHLEFVLPRTEYIPQFDFFRNTFLLKLPGIVESEKI